MSRTHFRTSLTAALALTALCAVPATSQTPEQVTLTGPRVAIWDVVGTVTLAPASGRGVTVAVTRSGRDASRLEIARGTIGGRETLRVIFPGDQIVVPSSTQRRGRWSSDFRIRDDGTFGGDDDGRWGEGRRVRVTNSGSGTEAAADLEIGVPAGQELSLYLAVGTVTARNIDGKLLLDTHAATVSATGMKGDLNIDTGSGDVRVDGMVGPLRVDVGSGSVALADVSGGDLRIDAGSGDVRGTGVASTTLGIDTGSGQVELSGLVAQDVKVDVGSGDVTLSWTTDPGDVNIDSGSGEVRLAIPAASGASVDLESSSGNVNSDFPISTTRIEREALRGSFGDGRGRIVVETGSGDVSLLKR